MMMIVMMIKKDEKENLKEKRNDLMYFIFLFFVDFTNYYFNFLYFCIFIFRTFFK